MLLLALAIAPGLAICIYVLYHDVYNREPAVNMIMSFFWGILCIVPAMLLERMVYPLFGKSVLEIIASAFLAVALIEESAKFLVLRTYSFTRRSFDEPLDGIVYSILVSMGFAMVENVFYVHQHGLQVAFLRMFTSVPAHATFAIIMGYYAGKAKFDRKQRGWLLAKGLGGAVLAHGMYDVFLLLGENDWIKQNVSEALLFAGALASLYIAIRLSRKLIRLHHLTSMQLFHDKPTITIRKATDEDILLIKELVVQVWPQTYASILSAEQIEYMMEQMYSEAALHQQMQDNHQFLIVYNNGIPIGFASYSEVEPTVFKLHKIYLLPLQQGRGSGRTVIEEIIKDITPKGVTSLLLNVNRNNIAKSFYEKLGFKVLRIEDIPIGNGYFMNDYIMELKLPIESENSNATE